MTRPDPFRRHLDFIFQETRDSFHVGLVIEQFPYGFTTWLGPSFCKSRPKTFLGYDIDLVFSAISVVASVPAFILLRILPTSFLRSVTGTLLEEILPALPFPRLSPPALAVVTHFHLSTRQETAIAWPPGNRKNRLVTALGIF